MPDDMTCHVGTTSADMSADSLGHKENCGILRLSTIPPTHHPPLCQPNHDKPLAACALAACGLAVSSSAAFGSMASGLMSFGFCCDG